MAFITVWPLDVGSTHVWHSNHPVVGRVTSLTPSVEVTLDPLSLSAGTVKFAGHPFEVLGYGKDRVAPKPRTTSPAAAPSPTAHQKHSPARSVGDSVGSVLGGVILLGASEVGAVHHPSSTGKLGAGTTTVVKIAENVPIAPPTQAP